MNAFQDCSDGGYEYDNDGDYECYDDSHDEEANGNESYYFGGEVEKNGDYSSYDEEGEDEEPYDGSYRKDGENE
ncbi:hypothetical protein H5410_050693 [Solanum commersonii]|uniref:Uncharacterized protein n=1 Tax=Solanum commersonii TaxID=4109 RepID=A0A9J5WWA1_SOLCO|nr:hypothetical protein H5410_050693 [Solanum commersonii]